MRSFALLSRFFEACGLERNILAFKRNNIVALLCQYFRSPTGASTSLSVQKHRLMLFDFSKRGVCILVD